MSSYAEKYAEPVKRISANGKEYTVSPLIQRDLRPWVKELRDAGHTIENKTERHGRLMHGSFRLVACPGEAGEQSGGR